MTRWTMISLWNSTRDYWKSNWLSKISLNLIGESNPLIHPKGRTGPVSSVCWRQFFCLLTFVRILTFQKRWTQERISGKGQECQIRSQSHTQRSGPPITIISKKVFYGLNIHSALLLFTLIIKRKRRKHFIFLEPDGK